MKIMNDDYLWDQTGADDEIAALEQQLAVFRSAEPLPPALPLKIADRDRGWLAALLSWRFLVPAGAMAACVMMVATFVIPRRSGAPVFASVSTPRIEDLRDLRVVPAVSIEPRPFGPSEPVLPRAPQSRIERPRPEPRQSARVKTNRATKDDVEVVVTSEEREAYEKLMLALSITGSKLKLVSDRLPSVDVRSSR